MIPRIVVQFCIIVCSFLVSFLLRENYTTINFKPMFHAGAPMNRYAHTGSSEKHTPVGRNLHSPAYTVYYSPTAYNGWRCDNAVADTSVIFVDIDDIDKDLSTLTDAQVIKWLKDTYSLSNELLPNYLMISGHGIHLYYIIDTLTIAPVKLSDDKLVLNPNETIRKDYTRNLVAYFKGDVACINPSRIMRCPLSFNIKGDIPIKTRLIKSNPITNTDIKRLDFFKNSYTEQYFKDEKERIVAKRNESRQKNNPAEKAKTPKLTHKKVHATINHTPVDHEHTNELIELYENAIIALGRNASPNEIEEYLFTQQIKSSPEYLFKKKYPKIHYETNFYKGNRYLNQIKDLNNYFCRHLGELPHKRDIFIFILSTILINARYSYDDSMDIITKYLDDEFFDEGMQIYDNTYNLMKSGHKYHYTNARIAELLEFTADDYKYSYCSYTPQDQKKRKSQTNKKYYLSKTKNQHKQKQALYEYIENNMERPVQETAFLFDVSSRTVIRYRNKIKNSKNT